MRKPYILDRSNLLLLSEKVYLRFSGKQKNEALWAAFISTGLQDQQDYVDILSILLSCQKDFQNFILSFMD